MTAEAAENRKSELLFPEAELELLERNLKAQDARESKNRRRDRRLRTGRGAPLRPGTQGEQDHVSHLVCLPWQYLPQPDG